MNKIDELILAAGTTGVHQVWFTRQELMKLKDLIVKECIGVCDAESFSYQTRRFHTQDFTEKNRLSSMECTVTDIAATISEIFDYKRET